MTLTQINKAGLDEIALDHVFTIGASGSSAYTFQGEGLNGTVNNPTLYLTRGKTYRFENGSGGHPIRIQSTSGASGTAYNTGVTNNAGSGTVIVEVQHDAPDVLYYQCTSHAAMNGILYITGALADGGVTTAKLAADAVTTAKIADDAVTTAKIAGNAVTINELGNGSVGESKIINGAVTTAKIAADAVTGAKIADDAINSEHYVDGSIDTAHIADNAVTATQIADATITATQLALNSVTAGEIANNVITDSKINPSAAIAGSKLADDSISLAKLEHGTSSNDGKFLRANNGADPTFETVSGTTINNNANNRLITGSGTANTLEAESSATYDGTKFFLSGGSGSDGHINMLELKHLNTANSTSNGTGDGPALLLNGYYANNEWAFAKIAADNAGGQYGSGYGSELSFWVHPANGTQTASVIKAADIIGDGTGANLTITDGNLKIGTAGHGINFNAYATSGNPSSNLLDDYEEGTWTLNYANGANYSIQSGTNTGHYVKVGRICFIRGYIRITSVTNGQSWSADISGLPFTSGISGYDQPISVMGLSWSWGSGQSGLVGQVKGGSTEIRLRNNRYDGHGYTVTANNMTNASRVWVAGCYYV